MEAGKGIGNASPTETAPAAQRAHCQNTRSIQLLLSGPEHPQSGSTASAFRRPPRPTF